MSGGGKADFFDSQGLDNSNSKGRTLDRVCTGTQLVDENKAVLVGNFEDPDYVGHMGGESGEGLLNTLLVTDVSKNIVENRDGAFLLTGDHQAAHSHKAEKADGLDRYGLTAGVWTCDDKAVEAVAQLNIRSNDLLRVDERMARFLDIYFTISVNVRHNCLHLVGKVTLGKDEVKLHKSMVALDDWICKGTHFT